MILIYVVHTWRYISGPAVFTQQAPLLDVMAGTSVQSVHTFLPHLYTIFQFSVEWPYPFI